MKLVYDQSRLKFCLNHCKLQTKFRITHLTNNPVQAKEVTGGIHFKLICFLKKVGKMSKHTRISEY